MSFYKNVQKVPLLHKCTTESKHSKYFLEGLTVQNARLNIAGDFVAVIKIWKEVSRKVSRYWAYKVKQFN